MITHTLISIILLGSVTVFCQNPKLDEQQTKKIRTAFQNTLRHIKPRTSPDAQTEAARAVARRLLGDERSQFFILSVNPDLGPVGKDTFSIEKNEKGQIEIVGTSGVAATWGLHYYLKTFCNAHISWEGNQIDLPRVLPEVKVKVTSNDRFRYYMNVCTMGYTFAWWQWDHWEKHIDWMALNGINLALAFNGQEAIWQRVYLQLNFTLDEINEHFGGPAFLPWSRMGNMRGFGGPLTDNWHEKSVELQHQILDRMRELGMIPVLPAFAGHVPRAFPRLFPQANVTKVGVWNNFSEKYCCPYLLDPTDPVFQKIGEQFLETYIEEFGTDHIYNCDTFNENEPHTSELKFLKNVGRSIFEAMNRVDPQAIWLMQGWLFFHDEVFWTQPRVQSFLTSVPLGRMIVLDLQSEQFPQYNKFNSYYGQPFIWCMLQNFGGTLGMFGSAQIINRQVFAARNMKNSTMVGTGLTPEGINQNYVVFELMNEMAYRKEPVDLNKWFENYAQRRYGAWNEYAVATWKNLARTVYGFTGSQKIRGKYVVSSRPTLNHSTWVWYDRDMFYKAWYVFLQARHGRQNSTLYRHDVVDMTRQAVQLKIDELYIDLIKSVDKENATSVTDVAVKILNLLESLDKLLASNKDFLLGSWLAMAKDLATNEAERKLYEYNARNQITLWGPRGEIRDYANKQWAGIVADYFLPRWGIFLSQITDAVNKGTRVNMTRINELMFASEQQFTMDTKIYPTQETGDSIEIAVEILSRWYEPSSTLIDTMKTLAKGVKGRI
ncbi:alpha-N-acetylglucosaminidase [Ceratina calcarata]|uniref:Alpha-N-acetylglucosaminidase n=1 Tax=Ceratina calcarata TaxID=156304 RepID=A0AAJ7W857_9HYME|nr:alpha-N-acetylglucosaminidase [Ceratina calcarata]